MRTRPRATFVAAIACSLLLTTGVVAHAQTVKIAAAGDIARKTPATPQQQTANLVASLAPAKVLVLGDVQYEKGTLSEFQSSYDKSWGAFNSIAAPVPGNHEYETPNASGYFGYFANVLSLYGSTATDPKKGYYSFNIGDWHVVGLNTNCSVSGVSCSAQRTWLLADLRADDHVCELVFSHHRTQQSLMQAASGEGVELSLSGHKHTYERWDNKYGLRQLVVGTGGKSSGTPSSNADFGVKAYGVAELTLDATSYSWKFIDVANKVRDSGSDSCEA